MQSHYSQPTELSYSDHVVCSACFDHHNDHGLEMRVCPSVWRSGRMSMTYPNQSAMHFSLLPSLYFTLACIPGARNGGSDTTRPPAGSRAWPLRPGLTHTLFAASSSMSDEAPSACAIPHPYMGRKWLQILNIKARAAMSLFLFSFSLFFSSSVFLILGFFYLFLSSILSFSVIPCLSFPPPSISPISISRSLYPTTPFLVFPPSHLPRCRIYRLIIWWLGGGSKLETWKEASQLSDLSHRQRTFWN